MAADGVEFADVGFTVQGGRQLLRNISFGCEPGTTTALLGRSGSGKTTLLRTVNQLVRPTKGRVLVGGRDAGSVNLLALRRGIGYVIQESGLFPHMSIARNLAMSLEISGKTGKETARATQQALERVGLQADLLQRYPWQLSGGQRQRVGVARALIAEPKVLLMDEPFGALDPLTRAEMQHMMRDLLRAGGVTTLIVTHDLQEALVLADRVVLMQGGVVAAQLAADQVRQSEDPAVREYVRATLPESGSA